MPEDEKPTYDELVEKIRAFEIQEDVFRSVIAQLEAVYGDVARLQTEVEQKNLELEEEKRKLVSVNDQLYQSNIEASILYQVASIISREIEMDKLLPEILNTVSKLGIFQVDVGAIFVVESDRMRLAAHLGHSETFVSQHMYIRVGECLCGMVAKTGEVIVSPDAHRDARHTIRYPHMIHHGHLIIPLKTRDRVEGVLDLYTPVGEKIDEKYLKLMISIGNQLGIAISNARLYDETKQRSLQDSLTGLWNHGEILRILKQEMHRAAREGGCTTAIMVDVDHFKQINDTYGHLSGDEILRQVAGRMRSNLRSYDAVGRYGGEEFLLILPGCDRQYIASCAERFRLCISEEGMDTPYGPIKVTISLGVATSSKGRGGDTESLIKAADSALYSAKKRGRNRVEISPAL